VGVSFRLKFEVEVSRHLTLEDLDPEPHLNQARGKGSNKRIYDTMKAAAILLSTIPAALCFGPSSFRSSRSNTESRAHRPSTDLRASLEAILFDCDGVLADTERDGHRYLICSFVTISLVFCFNLMLTSVHSMLLLSL
jgi:hypothetical protein